MNVKTFGLLMILLPGSAFAADLPAASGPPPVPFPTVFDWTGYYAGAQVGYQFGRSTGALTTGAARNLVATASDAPDGLIGGAHAAYLRQFPSSPLFGGLQGGVAPFATVIGIEGDVDASNQRSGYLLGAVNNIRDQSVQGSVRGKLGAAFDRLLVYATGGVAFGEYQNNYANLVTGATNVVTNTRIGYTIGGGLEYSLHPNLAVRVEYRFTDFGSFIDPVPNVAAAGFVNHRETLNRVQVGFDFRFSPFLQPQPVVARY